MKGTLLRMVVVVCVVTSTAGVATAAGGAQADTEAPTPDGLGAVAGSTTTADLGTASAAADVDIDVEAPQSSDDFLAAFRQLAGQESLSAYSEFEVIRTQAVVAVQSGSFDDADRERMRGVLRTLVRFDAAYAAAQNDSLTASFESATATREAVSGLESSGGTVYSSLASVALDRFFRSLGERFEQRSRADGISTPEQITALKRAGEAYRRGGSGDRFAEVSVEAEQLESTWERDQQEINESMAATQGFLDRCGAACEAPVSAVSTHTVGVFGLYTDARTASAASGDAVRTASPLAALAVRASVYSPNTPTVCVDTALTGASHAAPHRSRNPCVAAIDSFISCWSRSQVLSSCSASTDTSANRSPDPPRR